MMYLLKIRGIRSNEVNYGKRNIKRVNNDLIEELHLIDLQRI